jgi:hypothetical protein
VCWQSFLDPSPGNGNNPNGDLGPEATNPFPADEDFLLDMTNLGDYDPDLFGADLMQLMDPTDLEFWDSSNIAHL